MNLLRKAALPVAAMFLIVEGWFYVAGTGVVAPALAVPFFVAIWLGFGALLYRWRRSPLKAIAVPAMAAAVWIVGIALGGLLLGWTA